MSQKHNAGTDTDKDKASRKPDSGGHAGAGRSGTEGLGSEKPSDGLGSHTPDQPNTDHQKHQTPPKE